MNKNAAVKIISDNELLSRTLILLCLELGISASRSALCDGIINIIDLTAREESYGKFVSSKNILIISGNHTNIGNSDNLLIYPFAWSEFRTVLKNKYSDVTDPKRDIPGLIDSYLTANGKNIKLSERETELFGFLSKNAERSVSRDDIVREVWKNDKKNSNITDVYINYLRKKLSAVTDTAEIRAVRGKGYIYLPDTKRNLR